MAECRAIVLDELKHLLRDRRADRRHSALYELVLDYPLRAAKALRPALCIAVCRALGGTLAAVSGSAMALELYHNAFLIHDDVEDGSEKRRDVVTLHRAHGVPVAVNVGDAMLALALEPLLDNMRLLSVGKALRILQVIAFMARESAEGQAMELAWTRNANWEVRDVDYLRMIHKKTSIYSFVTPAVVGGLIAGANAAQLYRFRLFATALGSAFQVQDDILNLVSDERQYGKEIEGDLWEGKHTLILVHALRSATEQERSRATFILEKARLSTGASPELAEVLERLHGERELTHRALHVIQNALREAAATRPTRNFEDVRFLRTLIDRYGSLDYARSVAQLHARRAADSLRGMHGWLEPSVHRDFLHELAGFVVDRHY